MHKQSITIGCHIVYNIT